MLSRLKRLIVTVSLVLLAIVAARPYIVDQSYSATALSPAGIPVEFAVYERATVALFDRVSPSVVQISASVNDADATDEGGGVQIGTGFVWDAAGHIVTNYHVVRGAKYLAVQFASGDVRKASIVGVAPNYDLAVIYIDGKGSLPPPIEVGSSDGLKVGQTAFAIGNPFGLDQSLTSGIISGLNRRLPTSSGHEIANVIQTDAAINPGNSGGPLLNSAGRLIGVNTAIYSRSDSNAGIGFAIPAGVVNRVVPQLIRDGHIAAPSIGIVGGDATLTARLGIEGVVVVETVPGSPAERAGLQGIDTSNWEIGDVVVAANGRPVRRLPDLNDQLEQTGVGNKVDLSIERKGSTIAVSLEVADLANVQQ
jgi:S1-C subfamily serine protease